jgi:uncharacterized protein (TIRG00374 family)
MVQSPHLYVNARIQSVLRSLCFLAVGLGLLWWTLKGVRLADMWDRLRSVNLWWVAGALVLAVLSHLSRAERWRILFRSLGCSCRFRVAFQGMMVGYLANLVFPRAGEVVRCGVVSKYERLPMDQLIGTVVVERAVDLLVLASLFATTCFLQADLALDFLRAKLAAFQGGAVVLALTAVAGVVAAGWLLRYYGPSLRKHRVYLKVEHVLKGVLRGVVSVRHLDSVGGFIGHTVFIWAMYLLMMFFMLRSYEPVSHLGAGASVTTLTLGSLGMAAPVHGGIGTYHVLVENAVTAYGVAAVYGKDFAVMTHFAQTALVIFIGCASVIALAFLRPASRATPSS